MRQAYLDCSSGVSGDMFLAALLDAGVEFSRLAEELKKLPLGAYEFRQSRVMRRGLTANHVEIEAPGQQPHRHLKDIEALVSGAPLPGAAKQAALRIFRRLGEAEARLHGVSVEKVHFHEVGAVDAILDIAGGCVGFEMLGHPRLVCSPLNVGSGRVDAAHGSLPVPAPATAELLRGVPIYSSGVEGELVTPTGAALITELASKFGPMPPMKVERIGYGAGTKDYASHPNLARLFVGESAEAGRAGEEVVSVIEANVDDMSPQLYGYVAEKALAAGALDVTCASVQMKKNRPGLLLTVLAKPEACDALADLVFRETTTIGLRIYEARRIALERERVTVETPYGPVRIKVARRGGKVTNAAPEFDDCRRLAEEKSVPLKEVMMAASAAYRKLKD